MTDRWYSDWLGKVTQKEFLGQEPKDVVSGWQVITRLISGIGTDAKKAHDLDDILQDVNDFNEVEGRAILRSVGRRDQNRPFSEKGLRSLRSFVKGE